MRQTMHFLTYYGMEGSGPTVKEAKADAGRKLEGLVEDIRRGPYVVSIGPYVAIVFRGLERWGYKIIVSPDGVQAGAVHWNDGWGDRELSIARVACHLAQCVWSQEIVNKSLMSDGDWFRSVAAPYIKTREMTACVNEFVHWCGFQRRYAAARAEGYSDSEAHQIAGGLGHLVPPRTAKESAP